MGKAVVVVTRKSQVHCWWMGKAVVVVTRKFQVQSKLRSIAKLTLA